MFDVKQYRRGKVSTTQGTERDRPPGPDGRNHDMRWCSAPVVQTPANGSIGDSRRCLETCTVDGISKERARCSVQKSGRLSGIPTRRG